VVPAQTAVTPVAPATDRPQEPGQAPLIAPDRLPGGPDYRLGPDDQLSVSVLQAPELNITTRVSEQGAISLPLLGAVQAAGLTALELEHAIEEQLGRKYIKNPDVTVQVTDVRSHSVSVVGAVHRPGLLQVRSSTTLLDVLSLAGGLAPEAGDSVMVLRKEGGVPSPAIEVKLKPLMESRDPSLNVTIYPGDVVNVRDADIVYVVGAVNKPGAYAMRGNDRLTVLRALALGEGLTPTAAKGDALVVRTGPRGDRIEIPVDLAALLKGKNRDVVLEAHDVLFVPTSGSKVAARATLDALVRVLTWRPY
jgi:polysaccharide export outer membrane protein